jgi:hypothetical protein
VGTDVNSVNDNSLGIKGVEKVVEAREKRERVKTKTFEPDDLE